MAEGRDQEKEAAIMDRAIPGRREAILRALKAAFSMDNFPFVVLIVLATLSLLSRLWLLSR